MDILYCLRNEPEMGITDFSAALDLNKSTVYGLVNTLVSYGLLEQVESTKKYRLGIALYELGERSLARIDIRSEAKEICASLLKKYNGMVHLATHSAGEVVYLDRIAREDVLIQASALGRRAPMHCTGVGKAMLAFLPANYYEQYLSFPLARLTENTITDRDTLLRELSEIRRTGVAFDREEVELGVSCIAAPVFRADGSPDLAISLSFAGGHIRDIPREDAVKDVLSCSRKLSARLGFFKQ
jgi:DNA-binding IclR family transcriptional regulator